MTSPYLSSFVGWTERRANKVRRVVEPMRPAVGTTKLDALARSRLEMDSLAIIGISVGLLDSSYLFPMQEFMRDTGSNLTAMLGHEHYASAEMVLVWTVLVARTQSGIYSSCETRMNWPCEITYAPLSYRGVPWQDLISGIPGEEKYH
jgi:hypothetical protein